MASQLQISLLGPFSVTYNRQAVTNFDSNKVRSLLIYLAVTRRSQPRTTLASLLWHDHVDSSAHTNLRQALYQLRRTIRDKEAIPPYLVIDRQTIGLNPAADCTVDVHVFQELLATVAAHDHDRLANCEPCLEHLRKAVDLYHNDFLTGFALDDSDAFEEWRRITQEQLHLQAIETLHQLTEAAFAQEDDAAVLRHAQRQLALEPWREEAHRQIMRALAKRGQRSAALAQYESCRQILAIELGIMPDETTVSLYTQIRNGEFPPRSEMAQGYPLEIHAAAGATSLSSSLPQDESPSSLPTPDSWQTQLTPFVGRTAEIDNLTQILARADVRLVTLLGPGGIGKTRLAQRLGQLQTSAFAGNVFFIALAGLADGNGLATMLATTLGITRLGLEPEQALIQFLREKEVLLILDNFEHLLDHAEFVTGLLGNAPALKILVTSRERLHLSGEHLFVVEGLEYPPALVGANTNLPDLDEKYDLEAIINESSACQLFSQCAQRVAPYFQLTDTTIPDVLRICRLVEGMPLALEMAAAWLETLPLTSIADEIRLSCDFLASQRRDAPPRQQSIRAVFNWSWQLLDQNERQALQRCALFQGGFTRAAVAAVSSLDPAVLARLIHKSFVHFSHDTAEGRYQIHELLRQFAVEQLELAGEMETVAAAHSIYYLNLLVAQEKRLASVDTSAAVMAIQAELANIHQAWAWAVEHTNLESLRRSAYTLGEFYSIAGLATQGIQTFENASDALQAAAVEPSRESERQWLLATLLTLQTDFIVIQGDLDKAERSIEAARPLCQSTGNRWAETSCLLSQAKIFSRRGRQEESEKRFLEALQLVQNYAPEDRSDHPLANVELSILIWLAHPATMRGDYEKADYYYREGLALAHRTGNQRAELSFLLNMASLAIMRYEWQRARQLFTTVLPLATKFSYQWAEASALLEFGIAVCHEGEYEFALEMCQRALTIFRRINEKIKTPLTLLTKALIYGYLGEWQEVTQQLDEVRPLLQHQDDHEVSTYACLIQSTLAWLKGDFALGVVHTNAGLQNLENESDLLHHAHFLVLLGRNHASRYHDTVAQSAYSDALTLYSKLKLPIPAVEAQAGLAELALRADDLATALCYIEAVLATLHDEPYAGYDEPFFVYLTCYRVLIAAQDSRARAILGQGFRLLQHYVTQIKEDKRRRSFLENVPCHRELRDAAASELTLHITMPQPS